MSPRPRGYCFLSKRLFLVSGYLVSFFLQTEVRITDADLHPMFVQVALLQKGDYFVSRFPTRLPAN